MPDAQTTTQVQSISPGASDTAKKNQVQNINRLSQSLGSQSDDLVTALQAITAAINAKPSA